jgi:hypothetical protein
MMAAKRRSQSGGGSGVAVVFVVLLLLGLIVKFFWWIVGAAALVGAFFAVRAIVRKVRERQVAAAERDDELTRRADQQHRWTLRGDNRGVYGPAGAKAMRSVSPPTPRLNGVDEAPQDFPKIAAVAYTAEDLATLLKDKPPCWRWAAFASVLVQRRAPLQTRLHDSALGFVAPTGAHLYTGPEVARFVTERMNDLALLVNQVESFMLTPAFVGMFGDPSDESTADADGIVHTANRLMDYHERFLAMSEFCRGLSVPGQYADLMRDCAGLTDVPLQGYRTFVDEFVERVNEMPELLRWASGPVEADPVFLHMEVDDQLMNRITKRLRAIPAY